MDEGAWMSCMVLTMAIKTMTGFLFLFSVLSSDYLKDPSPTRNDRCQALTFKPSPNVEPYIYSLSG
ncbi:uncharacterized protein EV420DRAFT_1648757 [Desarmillaria tabescens]|uniref:Uncharacterized protein n=1 Tax=Armillaria tabescens TaxID=1929756 RepID=A0AA39MSY6_ARMTA|nr:uncharacterized protein EV420DRAFT_1648757 [Desarmillaria tabescens]KAK0444650.1 hypothetical protein EV420DRAFT_1648757 [Desarmillaria tabescens]